MALCLGNGRFPPLWAIHGFYVGFESMEACKIASWDDVPGGNGTGKRLLGDEKDRRANEENGDLA